MIITIDGPAASGKTTVAKLLSEKLNVVHFDTGALYRSFTWFYFKEGQRSIDEDVLKRALRDFDLKIEFDKTLGGFKYSVLGQDVTRIIRNLEVTERVSEIAAVDSVRKALIPFQRNFAKDNDMVVEGRDTGSVVFPKADWKFFLKASLKIRAERRCLEYKQKQISCDYEEVQSNIAKRDSIDSTRAVAPLVCPKGAHVIETDEKTPEEVAQVMFDIVKRIKE